MPLTQWFLVFYFVSQDKRGISAVALMSMLGTTNKTAGYMLMRIRAAMGQRNKTHQLNGTIEFDDTYFGGPSVGKNGDEERKRRRFLWLYPWMSWGIPVMPRCRSRRTSREPLLKKVCPGCIYPGQYDPQRWLQELYPGSGGLHP